MKKYLTIFLLLLTAFIISNFAISNIFLAQSPKINPFFAQNMMTKVSGFWSRTGSFFAFRSSTDNKQQAGNGSSNNNFFNLFKGDSNETNDIDLQENQPAETEPIVAQTGLSPLSQEIEDALATPLKEISQGIYAGEKDSYQVYEVKVDEIDSTVYTFNVNGKQIKIRVPKDKQPPTQEEVELIFK